MTAFVPSVRRGRAAAAIIALSGAALAGVAALPTVAASGATSAPTVSSTANSFVTTNGDILAENVVTVGGAQALAIGGNFTSIVTKAGTVAAADFAVIAESSGSVLYAASSVSSAGYVRAITSANGVIYVGGAFTSFAGSARSRVAAISTSTWKVTSWAPSVGSTVRALAASSSDVYVGGDAGTVVDYAQSTAAKVWSDAVSGGEVKALLVDAALNTVFVAGYMNAVGGFTNHGLVEVSAATGSPVTTFTPYFEPNDQPGADPSYNGENPFALSLVTVGTATDLAVASGGITNYARLVTLTTGSRIWGLSTPGDAQAITTVGSSVVVGYHRWRPNSGTAFPYFAAQLTTSGTVTSWNPQLSGTQTLADKGGNGTMALVYDGTSHTLFVGGAFTTYGATCNTTGNVTCTGGTAMRSLASYTVS